MVIRKYAASVGFEIVGKLSYMGKYDLTTRWYMDEAGNSYLVDTILGYVRIIPHR